MGHDHHHTHSSDARRLLLVTLLTGSFMVVEFVAGLLTGSLALIADAGHMLTDTVALLLAWLAARLSARPASRLHSYGYQRLQVLAAFVNALGFVALVIWILVEAASRLLEPVPVLGGWMLLVAALGLVVNLLAFALLHGGAHDNINVRAALLHVLGDLLGSVAAIVAAAVILLTGWMPIDPLLSVLVALLVLRSAWRLILQSGHILLEGAPLDQDAEEIAAAIHDAVPEVVDVHHIHLWSLAPENTLLTMHVSVAEPCDYRRTLAAVKALLEQRFGISHATVQIEPGPCAG